MDKQVARASAMPINTKVNKPDPFNLAKKKQIEVAKHALINTKIPRKQSFSHRKNNWRLKAVLTLIGIIILSLWVNFTQPEDVIKIAILIALITIVVAVFASIFGKRVQIYASIFTFVWLTMSYFTGFDVINTILLASFIIGLSQLFKT